jgi:hypothetical protein
VRTVSRGKDRLSPIPRNEWEGCGIAGWDEFRVKNCHSKPLRRGSQIWANLFPFVIRPKISNAARGRSGLFEQLQTLAFNFGTRIEREPRDITAWASKTCHEPSFHRINGRCHDEPRNEYFK